MDRLSELNALSSDARLWNDAEKARRLMSEKTTLEEALTRYQNMEQNLQDYSELAELAEAEGDEASLADLKRHLEDLRGEARHSELEALLNGEVDANDAFLEVHAGSGGTDAQDWAEMLLRMYSRWAEGHHYKVEYLEETEGEVAGLKSATVKISGHNAYGWLKSESGVHRLVRISPFDSNARRHTSFASVNVYPVVDDSIHIDINPADLKMDTYRSSGAGGQHINKTESAVRITHLPTGLVVECQDERSQHKNKDKAMKILRSRLYDMLEQERNDKIASDRRSQVGTGSRSERIRTYNFPEGRLTDHRIGLTIYRLEYLLNGNIDEVIDALATADQAAKLSAQGDE